MKFFPRHLLQRTILKYDTCDNCFNCWSYSVNDVVGSFFIFLILSLIVMATAVFDGRPPGNSYRSFGFPEKCCMNHISFLFFVVHRIWNVLLQALINFMSVAKAPFFICKIGIHWKNKARLRESTSNTSVDYIFMQLKFFPFWSMLFSLFSLTSYTFCLLCLISPIRIRTYRWSSTWYLMLSSSHQSLSQIMCFWTLFYSVTQAKETKGQQAVWLTVRKQIYAWASCPNCSIFIKTLFFEGDGSLEDLPSEESEDMVCDLEDSCGTFVPTSSIRQPILQLKKSYSHLFYEFIKGTQRHRYATRAGQHPFIDSVTVAAQVFLFGSFQKNPHFSSYLTIHIQTVL